MKSCVVFLFLFVQVFAQTSIKQKITDELKKQNIKPAFIGDNKIQIVYPNGKMLTKSLEYPVPNAANKVAIDSSGIDARTLDTSLYSSKYHFWQEVPLSSQNSAAPVIGDINKNGKPELYGEEKNYYTEYTPTTVYELSTDNIFNKVFQYPDSMVDPISIVDLNKDDNNEIVLSSNCDITGKIFNKLSNESLATQYYTSFGRYKKPVRNPLFYDFDKNGRMDVAYWSDRDVCIDEYNPTTQKFDSVFTYRPVMSSDGDFSVGDFDMNGKTDILFGDVNDDAFIIEAEGEHQYQAVWTSKVKTYNAYLNFTTNDIDSNGKPEFWVIGDAYFSGLGITRCTCFESDGNNSYHPVAQLDIIGIFSFFAGNCFAKDIDGDGKQEIFICLDQTVLIFKFTGSPNHHKYSLIFAKQNEMANQNSVYYGATLYDLLNNGGNELIVNMDQVIGEVMTGGLRLFSRIYKLDSLTGVKPEHKTIPDATELFQNYPNPFNPSTIIKYQIPKAEHVTVKIYDILGRGVAVLVDKYQIAGEHSVQFSSDRQQTTDHRQLSSGIYFYQLKAGDYISIKKMVLLK